MRVFGKTPIYTRKCLAIEIDRGLKADAVVGVMERLANQRGAVPVKIAVAAQVCRRD